MWYSLPSSLYSPEWMLCILIGELSPKLMKPIETENFYLPLNTHIKLMLQHTPNTYNLREIFNKTSQGLRNCPTESQHLLSVSLNCCLYCLVCVLDCLFLWLLVNIVKLSPLSELYALFVLSALSAFGLVWYGHTSYLSRAPIFPDWMQKYAYLPILGIFLGAFCYSRVQILEILPV